MTNDAAADLEASLLARAEMLATEFLSGAAHRRDEIRAETNERLHMREEREALAAQAAADKLQRQKVQTAEIHLQGEYDRMRWTLLQSVMTQLDEKLEQLANDEARYLPVLAGFITAAAAAIAADTIVVELNARDLARMNGRWEKFSKDLAPGKKLQLSHQPLACSGGALLHDTENRVRVNQTFEGRKQRMHEMLTQVVMEKLFAASAEMASHG